MHFSACTETSVKRSMAALSGSETGAGDSASAVV